MNLKTYAEENGLTLDEAKELTGLTHWNQQVPESCDEIVADTPDVVDTSDVADAPDAEDEPVVETKSKQEPVELSEEAKFSILILGNKSPHWNK